MAMVVVSDNGGIVKLELKFNGWQSIYNFLLEVKAWFPCTYVVMTKLLAS